MKAKYLFIIASMLLAISCSKEEVETNPEILTQQCIEAEYGEEFTIAFGETVCLPKSNFITFKDAKHHLCPCQATCETEGDILIELYTISSEGIVVTRIDKSFYLKEVFKDPNILYIHDITSFTHTYGTEDEDIPACASNFEKEKMSITFTID